MHENINTPPQTSEGKNSSAQRLHLQLEFTPDFCAALESELTALMYERLIAFRQRYRHSKLQRGAQASLKYITALGLCLSVAMIYFDYVSGQSIKLDIFFFILFSIIFFLTRDMNKYIAKSNKLLDPSYRWSARTRAASMLRMAKKTLPFKAEYELRDDAITYYRGGSTNKKPAWTRTLKHYYLSGQRATLLYKKETSLYPYILIMHESPLELAQYLDALGVAAISPSQQNLHA